jgi:type IV pilus assembly protein PilY1
MNTLTIRKLYPALVLGIVSFFLPPRPASAVAPAQTPLYLGLSAVKPNIMLFVDNSGSMGSNVLVAQTGVAVTGTSTSCNSSRYIEASTSNPNYSSQSSNIKTSNSSGLNTATNLPVQTLTMKIFSGKPKFCPLSGSCSSSNSATFGNSSGRRCFDPTKYYNVNSLGVYLGSALNGYINQYNGNFTPNNSTSLTTVNVNLGKRIDLAKSAATEVVNSLVPLSGADPSVRLGLARFNTSNDGAELLAQIGDLDATKAAAINAKIATFTASTYTPLSEALSDIGKYYATGYTGNLTLHPGAANSDSSHNVADIFTSRNITNSSGSTPLVNPIQGACQASYAIMVTDGLPTKDRTISTYLQDYDGDCSGANVGNCITSLLSTSYDMKSAYSYGTESSDFLDDVAQALYEMDLRPDLVKSTVLKNNVTTYTVGFADPSIDPSVPGVNPILMDAATQGGGEFKTAGDETQLVNAINEIIADISNQIGSSSSVATNSSKLESGTTIFQGRFDSTDWTGSLLAYPIGVSEDTNGNGILDTGEDLNNNSILDGGTIGTATWDAGENIPAFGARNIWTYNPATTPVGVTFTCANLSAGQKTALGIGANCTSTTDQGIWRLNYIRGDYTHEEINPTRVDTANEIRSTANTLIFRNRTHLDYYSLDNSIRNHAILPADPWLLGDIVNSDPVFVSNEDYGYDTLSGTEGSTYADFVTNNGHRHRMVYVGANDGMLHGFDSGEYDSGTNSFGLGNGAEVFAYIPNAVYSSLYNLSSPSYIHEFSVDGSPRVADAYFGAAWHTMLVSSTGAGSGKAIFALDVTDPDSFGAGDIKWEISPTDAPNSADVTCDVGAASGCNTYRGFQNNLGYTIPQASIVRMNDGSWAAIVANGYGSSNNLAVLYIIDIQTGHIIKAISTEYGTDVNPAHGENGLSTPIAVDLDGNRTADVIYAGDLRGNMWEFDVGGDTQGSWGLANNGQPLFVACTDATVPCASANRQPITAKPQVGSGPDDLGGTMVYFGTGKYFEDIDNIVTNAQMQSFYGIWDKYVPTYAPDYDPNVYPDPIPDPVVNRGQLQEQSIIDEQTVGLFNLRATTDYTISYTSDYTTSPKGWFMDLVVDPATTSSGERVVSTPLLRNGRIIFTTLIPVPTDDPNDVCAGFDSTSWLMELDALDGSPLDSSTPPWDINGDGIIDSNDLISVGGATVAPSGKQSTVGGADTPGVVSAGALEYKYTSGSQAGELEVTTESGGGSSTATGGRVSWRQLQ